MSGMARFANARQRRAILAIQDFRCALCGQEIMERFECDHVVPFSLGGKTTTSELQALCIACHQLKSLRDGSHRQA
ncbi:MAG: HNH endonuclease [Armatimonadia bacterium]